MSRRRSYVGEQRIHFKVTAAPVVTDVGDVEMVGEELQAWGTQRDYDLSLNLADHECAHGALPGDPVVRCDCWEVRGAA